MNNPRWQGIFPAITIKFHADENINAQRTARHIDFQTRKGTHVRVTCGSLGEARTLSVEEKRQVASIALEARRNTQREFVEAIFHKALLTLSTHDQSVACRQLQST